MSLKGGSNKKHQHLQREGHWTYHLQTVYPGGLNKEFIQVFGLFLSVSMFQCFVHILLIWWLERTVGFAC